MAKPASGTSLDTGHALYSAWTAVYGLLEGETTTSNDSKGSNHLTLSSSGLWTTNLGGENIIGIASATASPLALTSAITLPNNADWSIFMRIKLAANNSNGMLLGDNTNTNDFVWANGGNYLRYRDSFGSDADFTSITSFTTAVNLAMIFTDSDSKVRLYADNTEVNAGGIVIGGGLLINTLGNGYTSNTLALVGDIECCYIANGHAFSSGDRGGLHADPYSIFSAGSPAVASKAAERRGRRIRAHMLTR